MTVRYRTPMRSVFLSQPQTNVLTKQYDGYAPKPKQQLENKRKTPFFPFFVLGSYIHANSQRTLRSQRRMCVTKKKSNHHFAVEKELKRV